MTIAKYRPQPPFISPFNELVGEFLSRDIGQLFGSDEVRRTLPQVNIVEREAAFELRLLAPGFTKEQLHLNVEQDVLTISGEHKSEETTEKETFTRREFSQSTFSRSFKLPKTVNVGEITAEYTNGILNVNLPKAEEPKPKAHTISIG